MTATALTKEEKSKLHALLSALEIFADYEKDMPLEMIRAYLLCRPPEGVTLRHTLRLD